MGKDLLLVTEAEVRVRCSITYLELSERKVPTVIGKHVYVCVRARVCAASVGDGQTDSFISTRFWSFYFIASFLEGKVDIWRIYGNAVMIIC